MIFDPDKHHRRSIRLKGYDYSQPGAYFFTICARNRECLLGEIDDGAMQVNHLGKIVQECWDDLPNHYPHIELDAFVTMPNHLHGIIVLHTDVGAGLKPAPTGKWHGLPEIIRGLKTFSSHRINHIRDAVGTPVWQRNYYEHVIRNEESLNKIRQYIITNPMHWSDDDENPENTRFEGNPCL